MSIIKVDYGTVSGGGVDIYEDTKSSISNTHVDCGFQPRTIIVTCSLNGVNTTWIKDTDFGLNIRNYNGWGEYNELTIDATGFSFPSNYVSNMSNIKIKAIG